MFLVDKILVCGLPGSGKTTFSEKFISLYPQYAWYNADVIRKKFNDWDFSKEGRERQAMRMRSLAQEHDLCIVDLVAPTEEIRKKYFYDFRIVWMNTISEGRFEDTNKVFEPPQSADLIIANFNYENILKNFAKIAK